MLKTDGKSVGYVFPIHKYVEFQKSLMLVT